MRCWTKTRTRTKRRLKHPSAKGQLRSLSFWKVRFEIWFRVFLDFIFCHTGRELTGGSKAVNFLCCLRPSNVYLLCPGYGCRPIQPSLLAETYKMIDSCDPSIASWWVSLLWLGFCSSLFQARGYVYFVLFFEWRIKSLMTRLGIRIELNQRAFRAHH